MRNLNKASWSHVVKIYDNLIKPPSRPCRQQLKVWGKMISQAEPLKNKKALILGATPELRDLALKKGYFTWAVDFDKAMMQGMTKLMKNANLKKEKRIVADWLKIKLPNDYFDLVMADASLNNVLTDQGNQLVIKKIAECLRPGGVFILRNLVTRSLKNPTDIKYWLEQIKSDKLNKIDSIYMFRVDSTASKFKRSPQLIDSVEVYKNILKNYKDRNEKIDDYLAYYHELIGKIRKFLLVYEKKHFEKLLSKFFIVKQISSCSEHLSCKTVFPSYLLRKDEAIASEKKSAGWSEETAKIRQHHRVSPFAPNRRELKEYQRALDLAKKQRQTSNCLVLGATPELRDLAIKNGFKSYAVDISKPMLEKFSAIMKYQKDKRNIRILNDWLKMEFPKSFFDIIIGDAPFNNLRGLRENIRLVKRLKKFLTHKGILACRQFVYVNSYKTKRLNKLMKLYRQKKISFGDLFIDLRMFVYKDQVLDEKSYIYDGQKNFDLIEKDYQRKVFTKEEFNKIMIFQNRVFTAYLPEDVFLKVFSDYQYKLLSSWVDKSNRWSLCFPIYIFNNN